MGKIVWIVIIYTSCICVNSAFAIEEHPEECRNISNHFILIDYKYKAFWKYHINDLIEEKIHLNNFSVSSENGLEFISSRRRKSPYLCNVTVHAIGFINASAFLDLLDLKELMHSNILSNTEYLYLLHEGDLYTKPRMCDPFRHYPIFVTYIYPKTIIPRLREHVSDMLNRRFPGEQKSEWYKYLPNRFQRIPENLITPSEILAALKLFYKEKAKEIERIKKTKKLEDDEYKPYVKILRQMKDLIFNTDNENFEESKYTRHQNIEWSGGAGNATEAEPLARRIGRKIVKEILEFFGYDDALDDLGHLKDEIVAWVKFVIISLLALLGFAMVMKVWFCCC